MKNARHGGLSGKERVYRLRERVARKCAEDWVAEYLEPDGVDRRANRVIPIRGRADFLPSLTSMESLPPKAAQLELELRSLESSPSRQAGSTAGGESVTAAAGQTVVPSRPFRPNDAAKRVARFSFVEFAWGCALGGAAAAVLLMLAYWIVK